MPFKTKSLPLPFSFALEYAIGSVQENRESSKVRC